MSMPSSHHQGKIHILPHDVVSRIAAGEIVERPAAVVKELLENSLDAGSRSITVEVKQGGVGMIRVTDDGEGMTQDDARMAFQRHATSKLRSDDDLSRIQTMGFRGEALPSIAAVSRVSVTTTARSADRGTRLALTGGQLDQVEDSPAVPGTRVEVTDLFFNTPARRKFLRSSSTEFSHVSHVVQQAALAWPQVGFRLIHNGHNVLHWPAASTVRDRVLQVYRGTFLERALTVTAEADDIRITGFTVDPVQARMSKTPQDLFVNQRPIKNATVWHAVADGYGSHLAKGHHPVFVLFMGVRPERVDVNVHPSKREIRFVDAERVHAAVRQAVRAALGQPRTSVPVPGGMPSTTWRHDASRPTPSGTQSAEADSREKADRTEATTSLDIRGQESQEKVDQSSWLHEATQAYLTLPAEATVLPFGQVNRTFLVAQVGTELQVIDQHTAHERVLFERLWRAWESRAMQPQPLLMPAPIELPAQRAALLQRYLGELEKIGLVLEPFGNDAFIVRAVPVRLADVDTSALVQDLLDDLVQWDTRSSLETRLRPLAASLACHAAVRAGRGMALPEIKQLIEDWVQEGLIMTCPHGRRVAFRLSGEELARMFGRT